MMGRKTRRRHEAEVHLKALYDKWLTPLGLGDWEVTIRYYNTSRKMPGRPSKKDRRRGYDTDMSINTRWEYRQAYIHVNMQQVAKLTPKKRERSFVHELCHALVNETHQWGESDRYKHEERVVTHLACALIWTYQAGYDAAATHTEAVRAATKGT